MAFGRTPQQDIRPKRMAVYARYSSDLQRPSSIQDQIREARDAAEENRWTIVEEFIRCDESSSGQVLVGRDSFEELMKLAQMPNCGFDGIICSDTSRFGRNLSDTLPLSDILENAGKFLFFVDRRLDSRDPNFRTLFIAYGQQDEQYSRSLGEKVHRGQRGRVLNGYVANGRVYGYTNVPIENPHRKGLYGRPYVDAVKLEINQVEASVVTRIFELYVGGRGCRAIATKLNEEGVSSPLKGQSRIRRVWNTFAISAMLTNEKYRGVHVWNRSKVVRNPITHGKEQRPRPESEWERVEVPQWRIISEELWTAAVAANASRQGPAWKKVGGLNRTEASREYIFSGLMICAECRGKFNIVGGKGTTARYGCIGHRYRGTCPNKLTILRRILEAQLLKALAENVLLTEVRDALRAEFYAQVAAAWKAQEGRAHRLTSSVESLKEKREALRQQAEHLLDAIAATHGSPLVYSRLNSVETEMQVVDGLLVAGEGKHLPAPSLRTMDKFLGGRISDLEATLARSPELAKKALASHVTRIAMGPMFPADGPIYELTGDVGLLNRRDPPPVVGKQLGAQVVGETHRFGAA